ncbi:MAG TPA: hypothetical protein VIJ11_10850 [Galbitalea sp.]
MNTSSREVNPSASLGLAIALTAYLLVCLSARFTQGARSWFLRQFHAQRRIRRMLVTVGIFGIAITIGISAGGSTFALWNVSNPIGAVSLSTGTTGITVNGSSSYTVPGLTTTQLLPGLSAVSPVILSIVNTGTTPLSISVGTPVFSDPSSLLAQNSNLVVSLFQSTTCAQTVDGSGTAAWTAPVVVAAGGSVSACLQMTLSATAPASVQGLSATFTLPITGTQVRNNP